MPTVTQLLAKVGIDLSDVIPQMQNAQNTIGGGIKRAADEAQGGLNSLGQEFRVLSSAEARAEQAAIQTAQAHARALAAQGNRAGGVQVLNQALAEGINLDQRTVYQVQAQIANLERAQPAARGYGESFKGALLGIVGPAAAATLALGALHKAEQTVEQGFQLQAKLDESHRSLELLVRDVRDGNEDWQRATEFAARYGFTQAEMAESAREAAGILRQTKAPMEDVLSVLARLSQIDPEQGLQGAAIAVRELVSGDITSLHKRFEVPGEAANKMKKEIEGGADAVSVLNKYLNDSGAGMALLEERTEGAAGKMRELRQEQEKLTLAAGGASGGLGLGLVQARIDTMKALTLGLSQSIGDTLDQVFGVALAAHRDTGIKMIDDWARELGVRMIANTVEARTGDTDAGIGLTHATEAGIQVERDRADVTKLSADQLARLQDQLQKTADSSAVAYTRLQQAQSDYEAESADRFAAHQKKLDDIRSASADRLLAIDQKAHDDQLQAAETFAERQADIARQGASRLAELAADYQRDVERIQRDGGARLIEINQALQDRHLELRRASQQRLTEMEQAAQEQAQQRAEAAADRQRAYQERVADQQQQLAQRLADFDQQQLDRREQAQQAYQDRVAQLLQRQADAEEQARQAAADRERDYRQRLADQAEDAAARAQEQAERRRYADEDRAEQHADRLRELQERLANAGSSSTTGRITTLTGQTFTTEMTGGGSSGERARIEAEIAKEEERYKRDEERRRRDQDREDHWAEQAAQRAAERQAREHQRQEQEAADRLARQQEQQAAELAQLEQSYASQQAAADAAAAQQRQRLEQEAAARLADLQKQFDTAEAAAVAQAAKEDQRRQQDIAKEQAALAQRIADANAAAEKQRADLATHLQQQLADRLANYTEQRTKAQAAMDEQMADAQRTYERQRADIEANRIKDRQSEQAAFQKRIADEAESYIQQESAREKAYKRQYEQLNRSLGEQNQAYVKAQQALGLITTTEAEKRLKTIEETSLRQAQAERAAFDQYFGDIFGSTDTRGASDDLFSRHANDAPAGSNIINAPIGNITLPNVTNPQQFLDELRQLVIERVRANGGDANAYWGGS